MSPVQEQEETKGEGTGEAMSVDTVFFSAAVNCQIKPDYLNHQEVLPLTESKRQ